MKIKLNHCFDDWYSIIRAEHDGKEWWHEIEKGCKQFMSSERLSPEACIEGTSEEIIEVALAIKDRRAIYFKRIAIRFEYGFWFWSPKNSEHEVFISTEDADEFANEVIRELSKL